MAKTTTKQAEAIEAPVVDVSTETTDVSTKTVKVPKKYAPEDLIPCRSITYGELLLTAPKSKLLYSWSNYGDITEIEFQDLQALKSMRSSYIFKPRFIIEDLELVEQWNKDLDKIYSDIIEVDVEDLFNLPLNQFKAKLKKAPSGIQQAVKNVAGEKILNGSLDSLAKIRAIDEILGTDLKLYIS